LEECGCGGGGGGGEQLLTTSGRRRMANDGWVVAVVHELGNSGQSGCGGGWLECGVGG